MTDYEKKKKELQKKRENAVKVYQDDIYLSQRIPDTVSELFHDQFGIYIPKPRYTVPIVVDTAWKHILRFVQKQPVDEFSIEIAGVYLEYVTDISESDKSTNINPQLYHKKCGIFKKTEHNATLGSDIMQEQLQKYTEWRTVNLTEHLTTLEDAIAAEVISEYGLSLNVSAAILPLLSAAYTVAVEIARDTKQTINFYHYFEIDVMEDETVLLTPLSPIKQNIKNDDKK